jgi:transcription initiation factor TFIID subunit 2
MSTIDHNSHYWFPCVNSYSELNTWKIEVVVEEDLTVVSSGNLIEIEELDSNYLMIDSGLDAISMQNSKLKKYHFYLSSPTCAPNIGLCVGCF